MYRAFRHRANDNYVAVMKRNPTRFWRFAIFLISMGREGPKLNALKEGAGNDAPHVCHAVQRFIAKQRYSSHGIPSVSAKVLNARRRQVTLLARASLVTHSLAVSLRCAFMFCVLLSLCCAQVIHGQPPRHMSYVIFWRDSANEMQALASLDVLTLQRSFLSCVSVVDIFHCGWK